MLDDPHLFRSLFTAYPDALLVVDAQGTIVMANPAAEKLLGYGLDELQGLSVEQLVPDSIRPRHSAYRDAYAHAPRPRPMGTQMDLVARRADGSEVMVEIALSPLQPQGLPYVVAAIRGIGDYPRVKEALKRARYAECVAQMGRLAVDARDPEGLLREVPVAAAEALQTEVGVLFLLEPDGQAFRVAGGKGLLPGEHLGDRVPNRPDTPPGFVLAQARPVVVADYRDETRFAPPPAYIERGLVSGLGVPLIERGRIVGALTVRSTQPQRFGGDEMRFLDSLASLVTTSLLRSQSDEALRHAQKMESVGQLTGGIAHDFNNLLTVIQGNLQVLECLPGIEGNDGAQQMIAAAARASRRGAELTSKLLAFSRRQVLQPSSVDLSVMLNSLADMLRRTLDQRIRIEVDIEPGCPPCLADPGQLESALLNIAINARDAMPEGGLLRFTAHRCRALPASLQAPTPGGWPPSSEDYVAIGISDTGTGMPDAVKERAFEPFFTTKEAGRGTGLGLATVYGFATQSHGTVTIDSTLGVGTTLTLFIPRPRQMHAGHTARGNVTAEVPRGLRVLLVEDEPEVLRIVQAFLTGWGCEVQPCANAEQALAMLRPTRAEDLDLLITDVVLGPGLRGTELAAQVRALRADLPVLLMSGYSSDLLAAEHALGASGPELLRKPFLREELAGAIVGVIARSQPQASQHRPG
jgi:PAS domain S-box-containing protein